MLLIEILKNNVTLERYLVKYLELALKGHKSQLADEFINNRLFIIIFFVRISKGWYVKKDEKYFNEGGVKN